EFRVRQLERGVFEHDGRDRGEHLPVNVVEEVDEREDEERVVGVTRDGGRTRGVRRVGVIGLIAFQTHAAASAEVKSSTTAGVMSASERTRLRTRARPGPHASVGTWLSVWLRVERSSTLPW